MKEKLIEEGIKLTYDSLESHLKWTYGEISEERKKDGETNNFHKKCVKEYARIITIFSELL